jgi:hypothetical protein
VSYQSHFAFHKDKLQDRPTAFSNHNSADNLPPGDCANSRNHNAPAMSARSYCVHQESGRTLLQLTYEPSLASLSRFFSNSDHPYGRHSALGSHRSNKIRASLASIANLLNFHTNGHIVHYSAVKGNRSPFGGTWVRFSFGGRARRPSEKLEAVQRFWRSTSHWTHYRQGQNCKPAGWSRASEWV